MIVLDNYNVILRQLTHSKIELIRKWRNHPKIQQFMEYRDEITPEMQEKWFNRINNSNNYFFIIEYENRDIGLINIRDIDNERTYGESGIFIWDENVYGHGIAVKAGLCMYDFAFNELNLKFLIAHIFNTNPASIKYHQKFGFALDSSEEKEPSIPVNQLYRLDSKTYKSLSEEYKIKIAKLTKKK